MCHVSASKEHKRKNPLLSGEKTTGVREHNPVVLVSFVYDVVGVVVFEHVVQVVFYLYVSDSSSDVIVALKLTVKVKRTRKSLSGSHINVSENTRLKAHRYVSS